MLRFISVQARRIKYQIKYLESQKKQISITAVSELSKPNNNKLMSKNKTNKKTQQSAAVSTYNRVT